MKIPNCICCLDSQGEEVPATMLAPQTYRVGTRGNQHDCWHFVPICDGHADFWWEDAPPEDCPGRMISISRVLGFP